MDSEKTGPDVLANASVNILKVSISSFSAEILLPPAADDIGYL